MVQLAEHVFRAEGFLERAQALFLIGGAEIEEVPTVL
jgi:hypothetical protein